MTIRAQVIADMKADGLNRAEIAAVADQMSTQTASRYGTRHQGRSGRRQLRAVTYEWPDTPNRDPVADPDAVPEVAPDTSTEPVANSEPAAAPPEPPGDNDMAAETPDLPGPTP